MVRYTHTFFELFCFLVLSHLFTFKGYHKSFYLGIWTFNPMPSVTVNFSILASQVNAWAVNLYYPLDRRPLGVYVRLFLDRLGPQVMALREEEQPWTARWATGNPDAAKTERKEEVHKCAGSVFLEAELPLVVNPPLTNPLAGNSCGSLKDPALGCIVGSSYFEAFSFFEQLLVSGLQHADCLRGILQPPTI